VTFVCESNILTIVSAQKMLQYLPTFLFLISWSNVTFLLQVSFHIYILVFLSYFFHLFGITMYMNSYINGLLCNRRTVYQSKREKMKQKQRRRCIQTGDFSLLTVVINCSLISISTVAWRDSGSGQNSYSTSVQWNFNPGAASWHNTHTQYTKCHFKPFIKLLLVGKIKFKNL
jgi:hypothetical protein